MNGRVVNVDGDGERWLEKEGNIAIGKDRPRHRLLRNS